jgi:hypothetical protein
MPTWVGHAASPVTPPWEVPYLLHRNCGLRESLRALGDETKRAACLAALRRSCPLFVCFLITEEIGSNGLPIDGGGRISPMLRPPGLDHGAFGIAQGKPPGFAPQGIPDLLDEFETLPDRQPGNIDGWIYHRMESGLDPAGRQLSISWCSGDV